MILNLFRERICGVDSRLLTWEVVCSFEEELDEKNIRKKFSEDFPGILDGDEQNQESALRLEISENGSENCPENQDLISYKFAVFWKMISFNAEDGRRHRYLVALCHENESELALIRRNYDRMLPKTIAFSGIADKVMRENCCDGNLRLAILVGETLYILVYMEGRLCHWSEEVGYDEGCCEFQPDGESAPPLVSERLARFDNFLKADPLFSRVEKFAQFFNRFNSFDELQQMFKENSRNLFWRHRDLDSRRRIKPRIHRCAILAMLLMAIALFTARQMAFDIQSELPMLLTQAPELIPVPEKTADLLNLEMGIMKRSRNLLLRDAPLESSAPVSKESGSHCSLKPMKIQGIIAGRLFQLQLGNPSNPEGTQKRWLGLGDSIGNFAVTEINRDRVKLSCDGISQEIQSGIPMGKSDEI